MIFTFGPRREHFQKHVRTLTPQEDWAGADKADAYTLELTSDKRWLKMQTTERPRADTHAAGLCLLTLSSRRTHLGGSFEYTDNHLTDHEDVEARKKRSIFAVISEIFGCSAPDTDNNKMHYRNSGRRFAPTRPILVFLSPA